MNNFAKKVMPESDASIVRVTPKMAKEWLEKNTRNRSIRNAVVDRYAAIIEKGEWEINGESIKFDLGGNLLDGQHRLYAIIKADTFIDTYVIGGLKKETFDTLDTGAKRNERDVLALTGETNATVLAGALRLLICHKELGGAAAITNYRKLFTPRDILEALEKYPSIRDSASYVTGSHSLKYLMGPALATFLHYIFSEISPSDTETFLSRLAHGNDLEEGSPILVYRNKLSCMTKHSTTHRIEVLAIGIKAWNLWRKGKKAHTLRMGRDEEFPVAI